MRTTDKHFKFRYYQVECKDTNGGEHYWRFPFDKEGFKELTNFIRWLRADKKEGFRYFRFIVWNNC